MDKDKLAEIKKNMENNKSLSLYRLEDKTAKKIIFEIEAENAAHAIMEFHKKSVDNSKLQLNGKHNNTELYLWTVSKPNN